MARRLFEKYDHIEIHMITDFSEFVGSSSNSRRNFDVGGLWQQNYN
jgi:hypothetical protein